MTPASAHPTVATGANAGGAALPNDPVETSALPPGAPPPSLGSAAARAGATQLAAQVARLAMIVGTGMLLARLLTPADFGLFAMVTTLTAFVESFRGFGLAPALVHRRTWDDAAATEVLGVALRWSAFAALAVAIGAPGLAWFYHEPRLMLMTIVAAVGVFLLGVPSVPEALLMRHLRFGPIATADLSALVAGAAAAIGLAMAGAGAWAFVAQYVVALLVRSAVLWQLAGWRPVSNPVTGRRARRAALRATFTYGRHVSFFQMLTHLGRNTDRILVGAFVGPTALGFYDSANRWSLYPFEQVYTPLTNVAVATLSRVHHDPLAFRSAVRRVLLLPLAAVLPLLAFLAVEARPAVRVLLGPQWAAAVPIFRVLCIGACANAVLKLTRWLYLASGETGRQLRWGLTYAPLLALAAAAGVPWGAIGVATGFTTGSWLLVGPGVWHCVRGTSLRTRDVGVAVARPAVASAIAAALLLLIDHVLPAGRTPLAHLLTAVPLFGGSYVAAWLALPGGPRMARDVLRMLAEVRRDRGARRAGPAPAPAA